MSATIHEAVLGGARWRLTLHDSGRFDVAKRTPIAWDTVYSGNGGVLGVRESADTIRGFSGCESEGARLLSVLADVAERSTT